MPDQRPCSRLVNIEPLVLRLQFLRYWSRLQRRKPDILYPFKMYPAPRDHEVIVHRSALAATMGLPEAFAKLAWPSSKLNLEFELQNASRYS